MTGDSEIGPGFFTRSPLVCARELIGCHFRWGPCLTRIVETEAYAAEEDAACHTFSRPGARVFVSDHPAGTAYVYFNYGLHWLFNILVKSPDGDGFVLFRALEPLGGVDTMLRRRSVTKLRDLCNGPAKLTQALGIDGRHHGRPFLTHARRGLSRPDSLPPVVAGPRVGISRAIDLPWRFRAAHSPFASRSAND